MICQEKRISCCFKAVLVVMVCTLIGGVSCSRRGSQPPSSPEASDATLAQAKIKEADQLYAQRQDLAKVRLAVALFRQARIADPASYEATWKLSRASYYLGAHTTDETEREDAFREGIDVGKIATQLEPNKPDGHFWLGANYGGDAENSTLAGLANVEDIRAQMEQVIKLDEGYQSGSAYLVLGQLYLQAPRVLGGDTQKAIEYLEKGLRFGSENALLRLHLAEAYHAAKRNGDARKQIDYIMQMKPDPDYVAEYNEAVGGVEKLSEKMARER